MPKAAHWSDRREQEAANSGAGERRHSAERLHQSNLSPPALGVAKRGKEDVVAGTVEHLAKRRYGDEQRECDPDPVNERKQRA